MVSDRKQLKLFPFKAKRTGIMLLCLGLALMGPSFVPTTSAQTTRSSGTTKTTYRYTGTVTDIDNEPLPGVSVVVKGVSGHGVATDVNGNFSLMTSTPAATLMISYIGMKSAEVNATAGHPITVRLDVADNSLNEMVVTGYQVISKERATGSFGTVNAKQIEAKLATNLADRIEGEMAGVVLNKDGSMSIRGLATLNAEIAPLVVVDGYPTELSLKDLNPDNIANITVLKDAVAASIYGSRSANGVIVVTTKSGEEGKMRISYRGTLKVLPKPDLDKLHMANASDYIDAELDLYNQNPSSSTYSISSFSDRSVVEELLARRKAGMITDAEFDSRIERLRGNNFLEDMKKYMFRTELTQTHNLGISGGSTTNRYNLAINYSNTRGQFINTHSNRLLIDLKNEWKPIKQVTVGVGTSISYSRYLEPNTGWQSFTNWSDRAQPYSRLYDDQGGLANLDYGSYATNELYKGVTGGKSMDYNPITDAFDAYTRSIDFGARINAFVRYNVWDNINIEVGGNWNRTSNTDKSIDEADSYLMRSYYNATTSITNPVSHYIPDGDMINEERATREDWTVRTQISYAKSFGLHRISALGGNEVRRIKIDSNTYATRFGYNSMAGSFTPVNLKDLTAGIYDSDMINSPWFSGIDMGGYSLRDNRFVSWYLNGSYEYDNRYLVSGSFREDLTNFFGTDPKYRHKPLWSVGGTWKIANEKFFNADWVNRLNLRASYGINGNISLAAGPYLILSAGDFNSTTGGVSSGISSFPNNSLRWEKTKTTNVGVDFDVLDNRLGLSFDYYHKKTSDILAADSMDPTTGTSRLTKNVGAILNKGIEISVHGSPFRTRDFTWDVIFNMSFNKNKVLEYNVNRAYPTSWAYTTPIHAKGYPMYGLFGYRFAGLNNQGVTTIYGGDGNVKEAVNATVDDIVYLGTSVPKTDLSLTNNFRYRNWSLSFMFIAKLGAKFRKDTFSGSNYSSRYVSRRWQKPGDEEHTIYPVLRSWNMDIFYFPFCDVNIGNADYLKLRDLTLSYDFDKKLLSHIGMSEARIYLQGRNLFYITHKGVDIDPESMEIDYSGGMGASSNSGYSVLPRSAEYYVGLSFTF